MDDEIDRLVVAVRADTQGFAKDVASMRGVLEGPFGDGVDRAGRLLETTLQRAVKTGKLGFGDLKQVALSALASIADATIRTGLGTVSQGGGLLGLGTSLVGSLLGLPGRATGGPVAPGRGYLVGERGPEVFVPTSSGQIAAPAGRGGRDVRLTINVNAPPGAAPDMLARSSRQIARAVRASMVEGN